MGRDMERLLREWLKGVGGGPLELYLVGGAVRDRVLGRPFGDMDLMCRDAEGLARRLASAQDAVVVPFEKKPGMPCYRVVDRRDPDTHLDLSEMRGGSLLADLGHRDFTVNAMAMPVNAGGIAQEIVDPFRGTKDAGLRLLRMTGPRVFGEDPLRILRAFRFAAELGFTIEAETLGVIRTEAPGLRASASERVLSELLRLYGSPRAAGLTRSMDEVGVLDVLLPEIQAMKGCTQNAFHHRDVWGHSLAVLEGCEDILNSLETSFGEVGAQVKENVGPRDRLPLLKFAALLHDVAKPVTRAVQQETGRITFYRHDALGAEMVRAIGERLRMSAVDRDFLVRLVSEHLHVLNLSNPGLTKSARMRWFRRLGDDAVPLLILGMADIQGTRGPGTSPEGRARHLSWSRGAVAAYYTGIKRDLERKDLLTGKDLIGDLGMSPGPGMGRVLKAVREAQDDGEVKDREEALRLAVRLASG